MNSWPFPDASEEEMKNDTLALRIVVRIVVTFLVGATTFLLIRPVDTTGLVAATWTSIVVMIVLNIVLYMRTKNKRSGSQRIRRLSRKWAQEPPIIPPNPLSVKYSGLSDADLSTTMYDSQPALFQACRIFINPRNVGRGPGEGRFKAGLVVHGVILVPAIAFTLMSPPLIGIYMIPAIVLAYSPWVMHVRRLWMRDRFLMTHNSISEWSRQLPWRQEKTTAIPADGFRYAPEERSLLGKIFGYTTFVILTSEEDEPIKKRHYVRDPNRARLVLKWLKEQNSKPVKGSAGQGEAQATPRIKSIRGASRTRR